MDRPGSQFSPFELAVFAAVPLSFGMLLWLFGHLDPYLSFPRWLPGSFAVAGAIGVVFIVSSFGSFAIVLGKAIDWYRGKRR